jgi:hypothetical protein
MSRSGRAGLLAEIYPITTAPQWGSTVPERIAWAIYFLTANSQIYRKFRSLADEFHARHPKKRVSAELITNQIRWLSAVHAEGDNFRLNSNCKSLLARLYHQERPDVKIDLRKSWIDVLHEAEWETILEAWRSVNGSSS